MKKGLGFLLVLVMVIASCVLVILVAPLAGNGNSQIILGLIPGSNPSGQMCVNSVCPNQEGATGAIAMRDVSGDVGITQPAAPDRPAMEQFNLPGLLVIGGLLFVIWWFIRKPRRPKGQSPAGYGEPSI